MITPVATRPARRVGRLFVAPKNNLLLMAYKGALRASHELAMLRVRRKVSIAITIARATLLTRLPSVAKPNRHSKRSGNLLLSTARANNSSNAERRRAVGEGRPVTMPRAMRLGAAATAWAAQAPVALVVS